MDLTARTEARRVSRTAVLGHDRDRLGQFFTSEPVSALIASMPRLPEQTLVRVLDPGAGVGSLTASFVARLAEHGGRCTQVVVDAVEIDPSVGPDLDETLTECGDVIPGTYRAHYTDFTTWGAQALREGRQYDVIVMNPPYRKITKGSAEEMAFRAAGVVTTNLYTGFMTIALRLLAPGGQLVTITPRSFANGTYFKAFRRELLASAALRRIHVFESRREAFKGDEVLQENIICAFEQGGRPSRVTISNSHGVSDAPVEHDVDYQAVVMPDDDDAYIRIPVDEAALTVSAEMAAQPCRLSDTELSVSTGKVVDFRSRDLHRDPWHVGDAPYVFQAHLHPDGLRWPHQVRGKPAALADTDATRRTLLVPRGHYVLVKRFSAKEERRRVVACHVRPCDLPGAWWAFDNKTNYFHIKGAGLPERLASELTNYLNGELVDAFFRLFSGHTQVNAGDLRGLRYPFLADSSINS